MNLADYVLIEIDGMYLCPICEKAYKKLGLASHFHASHNPEYKNRVSSGVKRKVWNKGLTAQSDERVAKNARNVSAALKGKPGHIPSAETKLKTSVSMKRAHADGRAWNIGMSRWNNEPSWPEKFVTRVIENEFDDKNYVREYAVGKYAIDFAWVEKKLALEIDGDQHQRFEEYQQRDVRKDEHLRKAGWKVLRLAWKEIYNDTKTNIAKMKDFVHQ